MATGGYIKFAVRSFAIATLAASSLSAQAHMAGLVVGDQVRFQLVSPSAFGGGSIPCEGQVTRLVLDTAVVKPFGNCGIDAVSSRVNQLQVERRKGSKASHFWKGLIFGAIGGGLAGRLIAGDGCRPGGCDDGYYAIVEFTGAGIVSGAIIGSAIGFALPAGIRWRSVSARLVRVEYNR